jgi:hypothetical protein
VCSSDLELVPYNLAQYSQDLSNAAWTKVQGTITANSTTAPDGTTTADKIVPNTTNAYHTVEQIISINSNTNYTFSVYLKAGGYNYILLNTGNGTTAGNAGPIINLSNGTIAATFGSTDYNAQIESVGNGWYQVTFTFLTNTYGSVNVDLNTLPTTSVAPYSGDGTSGVFVWGAQLVEGSTAKDYQKTETRLNIPRLDYSLGGCPSVLVEPQRTNVALYSQEFDNNTAWAKINSSITANSAISPSGIQNADTITSTAPAPHIVSSVVSFGSTTNVSIFVKYISQRWVQLMSGATFNGFANFDIQNGIIGTVGSNASDAKIEDFGNGWYRISVNLLGFTGVTNLYFGFVASGTAAWNTFDPNFNKSIYAYGAQIEAGSYPTSYIPTTTASVTRNADVISKTGISSLIGQTEGTMFVDFNYFGNINAPATFEAIPLNVGNGTFSNSIYFTVFQSTLYLVVWSGGVNQATISLGAVTQGRYKAAVTYINNDVKAYLNGTLAGSDTSVTLPTLSDVYLGAAGTSTTPEAHSTNAAALWKTRLTNDQLTALTTI